MSCPRCVARLAFCLAVASLAPRADAHPDVHEKGLLSHFAPGEHAIKDGTLPDLTHALTAKVEGNTKIETVGPTEAFVFDGNSGWLTLGSLAETRKALPKREFTVAAWVLLRSARNDTGIVGCIQDNGDYERGWLLGADEHAFTFQVAATGGPNSAAGDGKLTKIVAKTPLVFGRWYYVVGTYDGAKMRLYINGELDGEAATESGDIDYPEQAQYAIGRYVDDNESYPLDGAVYEVKTYSRALGADELVKVAKKNAKLVAYQPPQPAMKFVVQPYLQFGTQTSMVVMCETSNPAKISVAYGIKPSMTDKVDSAEGRLISEVKLEKLTPFTSYFYRVTATDEAGEQIVSDMSSFQTAPKADVPWAFTVIGDTQRNPDVTRKCAEGAYALRPNFMLHCGDVVDDGHAKHQWVQDLLEPMSVLTSRVPLFPVIGNHEQNSHWYYDYFSLPAPEYYYTFHYGNAQFFMIDSNKPLDPKSEQYQWLDREMAKSKATWKFTCHHHPCFSSDENDYGDHVKGEEHETYTWGDPNAQHLVPLYEKYGVDIAWNGHIHVYERTWPIYQMSINQKKGVRYITSGGGGGGLENPAPQRAWFSLHFKRAYHFCYLTIHDRTIQLKAYDIEGRLFDTFELTKPEGR